MAPDWCNTRPICGVAENAYNSLLGQGLGPALRGSHAIQHASALATCGAILPVDHRVFLAAARAFDHLNEVPHVRRVETYKVQTWMFLKVALRLVRYYQGLGGIRPS